MAAGVAMALSSWPVLGALLDDVPDGGRAWAGVLVGALAAAPALLLLSPRIRERALGATLWWLLAAAVCILLALPFRRGGDLGGSAAFREQAGSYVLASALAFLATAVVLLRRLPADAARPLVDRLVGRQENAGKAPRASRTARASGRRRARRRRPARAERGTGAR